MVKIITENDFKEFIDETIQEQFGKHGGLKTVSDKLDWSKSKISRIVKKKSSDAMNINKSSSVSLSDTIKLLDVVGYSITVKKK